MHASYRTIFTEVLLAQSAAIEAFADAAARCVVLAAQQYQQTLVTLAGAMPPDGGAGASAHPDGGSGLPGASFTSLADLGRAFAGLPRVSMMIFLSRYDDLRGRRSLDRD
jgi:hypothetical protein